MNAIARAAIGNASPGVLRRAAMELGLERELADQITTERPDDIVRWARLGEIPAEEDPRNA